MPAISLLVNIHLFRFLSFAIQLPIWFLIFSANRQGGTLACLLFLILFFVPIMIIVRREIRCVLGTVCHACLRAARFILPIRQTCRTVPGRSIAERNAR